MDATTQTNTSFSTKLPTLQLALDSTSLGEFKVCPRKYYYSIVEGWRPRSESPHLTFGILLHRAREVYDRAMLLFEGDHPAALQSALRFTLKSTWDSDMGRPWSSGHGTKNRSNLVQTVVWYLDQFKGADPLVTHTLANGLPAVELSFRFEPGIEAPATNEPITLCGHMDRIATLNGEPYITDIKTTGTTISPAFFAQYSPDNQMSLYTLAGQVAFGTPVKGVIIDGIQVAQGFARFERGLVERTPAQVQEWLNDLTNWWVPQLSWAAQTNQYPMNDKSCHQYGGCPFRPVCSRPPAARQKWLETDYVRRVWDPLQPR